ncbi:hypothetical protein [Winogradskyella sp. PG-2]|uniref:hypothetical protein n=1 Tax=Winogradskyella sp. PG-2 TaxID=754409 RepID=UPI0004588776|nr:hypothetical protein [Winogradskyella sp. PG-2]BAO74837.1 hypothetical protein WPG_0607 [Winogradskyella sp. PG-2]
MNLEEKHIFSKLKLAITQKLLESNSAPQTIEDWKGDDIIAFQEDLFSNVKGRVSEKWFYTYIKHEAEKLPRIDILNLLSKYVGYQNWTAFKAEYTIENKTHKSKKSNKNLIWLIVIAPCILLAFSMLNSKNDYQFCFYDSIKNEPIGSVILNIKILKDGQSPIHKTTDSLGCFNYVTKDKELKFIVESPYYKTDTIVRQFNSEKNKIVKLVADDYALMLNYYTNKNISEWKTHREKLNTIFNDNAEIYQLFKNSNTIELYTKREFIQKLTIPTRSLRGMEILDKTIVDGKIVKLKFIIH